MDSLKISYIFWNFLDIKYKIANIFKYIKSDSDIFGYPKYFGSDRFWFRFSRYQNFESVRISKQVSIRVRYYFFGTDSVWFFGFGPNHDISPSFETSNATELVLKTNRNKQIKKCDMPYELMRLSNSS